MEERSDESSERREGREIEEIYIYICRETEVAAAVLHDRIEENTGRKNLHLNSPHLISKILRSILCGDGRKESRPGPLRCFCFACVCAVVSKSSVPPVMMFAFASFLSASRPTSSGGVHQLCSRRRRIIHLRGRDED